mmetsp:Transcript_526/g.1170  ORF Transcript_526/g.1170 Transcript_526/m.1170 type:complete len:220 (-) Transcript_526:752-1411(-)|eukprot:CAMPEP_0201230188 /NCGR_PEP_ID=MMETSP0852-20130820/1468_1 /ASSEMBLY_ACC=CAM_ASM_000632 /TAXON_ID=183588 /ORGANISM="Pseudo-nitzschia fraudulenta, Strain WWA7" /LENGTH=219 /DNA_ID=CAMNT_0047520715 /DNA_START=269 /DNA_END=928 /DNA_ORIENTATION=-
MTASEISSIALTVGTCQLLIDLLSNYVVYGSDPYQRSLRTMERFRGKLDRAQSDLKKSEKHRKKFDRAKADYAASCADVARRHFAPNLLSSIFFVILLRILGIEHKGKVMGVIPFNPFNTVSRISSRGLDWRSAAAAMIAMEGSDAATVVASQHHPKQALSFFFVYVLSCLAVKYYVNRLVGTRPPKDADGGITTIMDSPIGQRVMRSMGVDPDDLKME